MKTIVIDIETFPCAPAMQQAGVDAEAGFPPWPLHELACVSLLSVDRDTMGKPVFAIETFARDRHAERGIVASVERAVENAREVITFNGRGFDVPVLLARAAVCGEPAPAIAKLHSQGRFVRGAHLDLLEEVTARGAAPRIRLLDLCAAFRVPVKFDCAGDSVATMVEQQAWERIANYCETDVVATWLAAQYWRAAERASPDLIVESWTHLARWIRDNQPKLGHLVAYDAPPAFFGGGAALGDADWAEFGL